MQQLVLVGKIAAPHGVKGEIKIISYTQNPEAIFGYSLQLFDSKPLELLSHKPAAPATFICKIKDIENRNEAEKLTNLEIFTNRSQFASVAENEFYIYDLKGMTVVDAQGKDIGTVVGIYNFGAGDIIEIKFNNGKIEMFSFSNATFPQITDKITFIPPKIA